MSVTSNTLGWLTSDPMLYNEPVKANKPQQDMFRAVAYPVKYFDGQNHNRNIPRPNLFEHTYGNLRLFATIKEALRSQKAKRRTT